MTRLLSLAGALLLGLAATPPLAAQTTAPVDLVQQAVTAMGGAQALGALKTLTITAEAKHWEPEQSLVADGPPRALGTSTLTVSWDLVQGMARTDWGHTMLYPFPGSEKYSELVTPSYGAVIDDKGERPMSSWRLAFELRERERASPVLLLKALNAPQRLAAMPDQKLAGTILPAISFADGAQTFTILFDPKTHLPAAIRSFEDDDIHGDGAFDLLLGDWQQTAGARIAHGYSYKFNGLAKLDIAYQNVVANAAIPAQAFAVGAATRQAAEPPATGDVPWQAVLVGLNFGRYNDLEAEKAAGEGPALKLVELAPNVQQVMGRTHNSLVVAMKDYLVVFDAPQNEAYARAAIDAMTAKYPGKPIKYLVLTHHHMDHIGGARTYVASGATVIVGSPDKAHMEKVFKARHTMHPDELQRKPRAAGIIESGSRMSLKDSSDEIDIYRIPNPHAEGMLIGYVASQKLVWVTDLYSPGRDKVKTPNSVAFHAEVEKLGLHPARYAGGHGSNGSAAEFEAIMDAK
jgi:glyoxylase-like metal-dependent hydrolase (beta-lactamase superfamily II)